ncbi:MAG TPA: response regulator, partial [Ktedonobacterales bacterium]|nr:response regulator [Ktedonobacterales bacterium]
MSDAIGNAGEASSVMGARVLVVDDEPEIRRAVRAGLAGQRFAVESASTGGEGLDIAIRWHPDVIILDLSLPDVDGIEVARQLRSWSRVPIIVLSVRARDADKITA